MKFADYSNFFVPLKTGPYAHMNGESKFWSQVNKDDVQKCWLWQSKLDTKGYGILCWRNRGYLAHRVSYWLSNGYLPADLLVCHKCDTPRCVNPSHLFLGDARDNSRDMHQKGRARIARGERSGKAFLTDCQVAEIKWLLANTSLWQIEIARMYSIPHVNTVSRIKNNHRWGHILPSCPPDIAAANLAKLADRAQRGVIGGSGDDR